MTVLDAVAPGQWFDPDSGQRLSAPELFQHLARQRVVLLGEYHDRFDIHRWQLSVAAGLLAHHGHIAIGFEMFPRAVQPALDRWTSGETDAVSFLLEAQWETVWRFDPALYMPLFHFCRENGVRMLALNCHRPLVTRVGKDGWDAVPDDERDGLTPALPASPAHRAHLYRLTQPPGAGGPRRSGATGPDDPLFDRFVRAQQVWDRAFACNIAGALDEDPDLLVVGIIGRGHCEFGFGTPNQLADLGIDGVAVLLTADDSAARPGQADATFRLPDRQN